METIELNISPATLSDQQKSHEPSAQNIFTGGRDAVSFSAYQPLKEIKGSLAVKRLQTKLFFITLITSNHCLAKIILFNCLISPSHYSIQYFLYWRQAAYGAQLYRSVLVMVRHACAERRQREKSSEAFTQSEMWLSFSAR